jgi:hypothetical protein
MREINKDAYQAGSCFVVVVSNVALAEAQRLEVDLCFIEMH